MELYREFAFDAAHRLPHVPSDHKCARLHGHSYRVTVYVEGPIDEHLGWVMDFADLKQAVDPVLSELDHQCLNGIGGLENPTAENLARWLWTRLKPGLPLLSKLRVAETCTSGCIYRGEPGGRAS